MGGGCELANKLGAAGMGGQEATVDRLRGDCGRAADIPPAARVLTAGRRVRRGLALLTILVTTALLGTLPLTHAGAQSGQTVDLAVLVVAGDATADPGLALIEEVLIETGVAYDVLDANVATLTAEMLADGDHGFFNGIILTDAELFVPPDTSGFTVPEWEVLHDYERTFGVREVVMSGSPSDVSAALDYGLEEVFADSGIVGEWVGPAGETVFKYVSVANPILISDYAVATRPTGTGPTVTPVLVDSANPDWSLISVLDYPDGRQVLFSSVANASFLVHSRVLAYEFVRFATSGLHLGAHRIYLTAHVDDMFLGSAVWNADGSFSDKTAPYRNEVADIEAVLGGQQQLNAAYQSIADLRFELAFNGLGSPLVNLGDLEMLADAAVAEDLPNRRYGRAGILRAGRTGAGRRAVLYKFDALPPTSDIGTVLRLSRSDDGPTRGSVCALTQAWDEDEVTWASASAGTAWEGAAGPAHDAGSCIAFDLERSSDPIEIRSLIDRWSGGEDNHGVVLRVEGRSLSAPSRESGAGAVLHYGTAPTLPDPLSEAVLANADELAFLNHTFTHRDLDSSNATGNAEAFFEISRNIQAWAQLGLPGLDANRKTLVTGQHSGLSEDQGTFFDQSDDIFFPDGANPALLDSMEALGIRYVAGDSSRPNQMVEQRVPGRDIVLLPRYPANVFFDVRTPTEMTAEYNFLFHQSYLDRGLDPCVEPGARCEPVAYETIIADEARLALLRLLSGRRWPHYFHIANIVDYDGQGSTLIGDWLEALLDSYEELVVLPIESPRFHELGERAEAALLANTASLSAVLDRESGLVTISSDTDLTLEVSGLQGGVEHGGSPVQSVALVAGAPLDFSAATAGVLANARPAGATTLSALANRPTADRGRLLVAAGSASQEALITFEEVIGANEVVLASLSLRDVRVHGSQPVAVEVCRVTQEAAPAGATWTSTGAGAEWTSAGGAVVDNAACVAATLRHGEDTTVDISGLAASWSGGEPNYGVAVRTGSGIASFGSFGSLNPPTLVITTQQ